MRDRPQRLSASVRRARSVRRLDKVFRKFGEIDMTAAIARLLPRASATSVASIESFVTVALFGGIGLLLSLSVVILDQYIPGEWF
jgi:hypothetical protein